MTQLEHARDDAVAVIDGDSGETLTHAGLAEQTARYAAGLAGAPSLVFHFAANTLESVVMFLGARAAGHAVALLDPTLKAEMVEHLVSLYRPQHVSGREPHDRSGYSLVQPGLWSRAEASGVAPHPDLGVLLSTSGSTGSPKLVRLSASGIEHNARAIARSLDLEPSDRGFATLPLHYSYGMSVLTSHLAVGASVVLSGASVVEPRYWEQFTAYGATSLSGVPYTYQMLDRLGFLDRDLPSLRAMTQAGGRLSRDRVCRWHEALDARGVRFYVMYGQTEAAPRMACLPPAETLRKLGSVGLPLPGGRFAIETADGDQVGPGEQGEVVYRGPNVMMGYATSPEDLALGDVIDGVLHTGDLGHLDEDGYLFLTGRSKRIGKVFGVRVSLDEVEDLVTELGPVAVVADDDRLRIFHERGDDDTVRASRKQLALDLKVPTQALLFRLTPALPVLPNGKTDYQSLQRADREGES